MEENKEITISNNTKGNDAHLPAGSPNGTGGQFAKKGENVSSGKKDKKEKPKKEKQKSLTKSSKEEIIARQGESFSKREKMINEHIKNKDPFETWALNPNGSLNQAGRTFIDMKFYTPYFKETYLPGILDFFKDDLDEETPYVEIMNDEDDKSGADFVLFFKDGSIMCIDLKSSQSLVDVLMKPEYNEKENYSEEEKKIIDKLTEEEQDKLKKQAKVFSLPVIREFGSKNIHRGTSIFKNNNTDVFFMMNLLIDRLDKIEPKNMYNLLINDTSEGNVDYYNKVFSTIASKGIKLLSREDTLKDLKDNFGLDYKKVEKIYDDAKSIFEDGSLNQLDLINKQLGETYQKRGGNLIKIFKSKDGKEIEVSVHKKKDGKVEASLTLK